ncbi:MAG: hypothetical protein RR205_03970 [Oscillospiraceae bacterium]
MRDCPFCLGFKNIIDILMKKFSEFNVWEVAALKAYMLTVGILIGSCFSNICKKLRVVLIIVWGISFLVMTYRLFLKPLVEYMLEWER